MASFLKISNQHAINISKIQQVKVEGRETDARLMAYMDNGDPVILGRFKNFPSAEKALTDLLDKISVHC